MRFPRYWQIVEGSTTDSRGKTQFRRVWGWSAASAAEARAVAEDRLREALAHLRSGDKVGGYYPRVPLREPVLDELVFDGERIAVITRNRYGAEVLNTDRMLIADVDLAELIAPKSGGLLRRLFGRAEAPAPPGEPMAVTERLALVERWATSHPEFGVVVYRTASGLRIFVSGVTEPTTSAVGQDIMAQFGTDPVYRELCRVHGTFRARLTPKPWRLRRLTAPRDRWPFADDRAAQRFQSWLDAYDTASRGHAVCRRLATFGPSPDTVEQQILARHDERTGVSGSLPLA